MLAGRQIHRQTDAQTDMIITILRFSVGGGETSKSKT